MMDSIECCQQKQSSASCYHAADIDDKEATLFLLLPLELRYMIYEYILMNSRRPPAEAVHEKLLSKEWKDEPSPLLTINKQVRAEIYDLLRQSPFTLRITWQDKRFDALALSSFIVQQRQQGYENIPHLVVEIWPPHSDRPIDVYYIYEHLRLLREDLRAIPRIPKLDLIFLENSIAAWSSDDGKLTKWLEFEDPSEGALFSDMSLMLELFERLTNVSTARIYLPGSFTGDERYQEMRVHAQQVTGIMTGAIIPKSPDAQTKADDAILEKHRIERNRPEDYIDCAESCLKRATARIAREKLKTLTKSRYLWESEYEQFTEIWPHFETLDEYEVEGEFLETDYVLNVHRRRLLVAMTFLT